MRAFLLSGPVHFATLRRVRWLLPLFIILWVGFASLRITFAGSAAPPWRIHAAPEPCRPLGRGDTLALDAAELPLGDLTRLVSCALERNLLLSPPTLAGKTIGIFAPRPLTRRDLLTVWHTALERHGLVEERRGALYLVRPVRAP